ncbi:hypothetical protein BVC93_17375 [Mycobacterium sp. MS1601]|uniref:hypothetical protein n=1 Tax=Mycobacterium sp. MS1601 TaxID=1936029 RepID=UPI0009792CF0|nr:hypothetical protein [Mycobacterium sp. MS1601]AQA03906.1 hypothetical protein BVC93_17375 [Mycobacterium sp. MS1601]
MNGQTVEQLKVTYSSPAWRKKFVDFCDLMELLADCTIADSYTVSDELNTAIKLTDVGTSLVLKLTSKDKVKTKDARLMCALTIGHAELFVDIDNIDIESLVQAIDASLTKNLIRFPFVWGRDLYDAYASLFEDEREYLNNEETLRLLDQLPQGVFQYGAFTVGPYGLHRSSSSRTIAASRRIPAYHCSRTTCQQLHPVLLQTGRNATIHQDRDKLDNLLEATKQEASEWWAFASEISGVSDSFYGDRRAGVLLPLIGDTLSTTELQSVVIDLLDNTKGEVRGSISGFLDIKKSGPAVEAMNRAELLQITLMAREDTLSSSLDKLVRTGCVTVELGDIRKPVINRNSRSGAFRLRAELGHYGVRFLSEDLGLALLRERRLLKRLYVREPETDVEELDWQLRGIDIDDLDERLEHFFHTRTPADALERLVLARKTNMITACFEVGIEHGHDLSDQDLINTLLWKLGFPVGTSEDPHADFWRHHERLWALTQSSDIGRSERFREAATPYFTDLEGLLLDALAFTAWGLLIDHTGNETPFAYDDHDDRRQGLSALQAALPPRSDLPKPMDYTGEHVELRALMDGFRSLAAYLERCRATPETYQRPENAFPRYDGKTDLKAYLLRSTLPFLNLSSPSQDRIIHGLKEITEIMEAAEVNRVRNEHLHYRRTAPDISRIERALEATRQAVTKMENLGFCRMLFIPSRVSTDQWGQSSHEFIGPRSNEHFFARPTTLDWMGLPELTEPQYLLRAASFGDPNEVLRFTRRYQSEFSEMWKGFPNRRRRGQGLPAAEENPAHPSDIEIASS